jgi:hypothetical protein
VGTWIAERPCSSENLWRDNITFLKNSFIIFVRRYDPGCIPDSTTVNYNVS